jgi:hypothetical protein
MSAKEGKKSKPVDATAYPLEVISLHFFSSNCQGLVEPSIKYLNYAVIDVIEMECIGKSTSRVSGSSSSNV